MPLTVEIREPSAKDGNAVWKLVQRAGRLDLNSPYCYLLLCDVFRTSCVVAEWNRQLVGFLSAVVKPEQPDTLFVWQIAVDPLHRGLGVGKSMLRELTSRSFPVPIRYLEATVSESNIASNRLFRSFAEEKGSSVSSAIGGYTSEMFADQAHEHEPLLRMGPMKL